jgi:hypothetical protein
MDSRTWLPLAAWLSVAGGCALLGGCSLVDPNVGPSQTGCAAQAGATPSSTGYYGSASANTGEGTCSADAGSACDDCESRWCCPTRLSCYADPVCNCADQAMGTCEDKVTDAAASDSGAYPPQCWSAFSASGEIAEARVSCLRAWCQKVCGVP